MSARIAAAAAALFIAAPAPAQQGSVPGCYARYPVNLAPAPSSRALFVLIDQTTALDPALTRTLGQNVARLVRPGTSFTVASFSAFRSGHFVEIVAGGTVEPPVPANRRNTLSVPALKKLDACLRAQSAYAVRTALVAVRRAQATGGAAFSQSEIMASLRQLSAPVAASRAPDKVVVIASDMLEHSSATSFYSRKGLRPIDPSAEMRKAAANRLFANFGGARVYVIGAGVLPPESKDLGRTIAALDSLESFWSAWFRQSRARFLVFGKPNLVSPIP